MDHSQNNDKHFVYFYINRDEPDRLRQVVPTHVQYWKTANLKDYMGGPFSDRTGGLISFVASSFEKATEIIQQDPFVLEDLIDQKWIKEWILETGIKVSGDKLQIQTRKLSKLLCNFSHCFIEYLTEFLSISFSL
jgi:uncharacterized protein YciI